MDDPGSRGSSRDETFILSFVFFFFRFSIFSFTALLPHIADSFVAADPVMVPSTNKAPVFFFFFTCWCLSCTSVVVHFIRKNSGLFNVLAALS